MFASDYGDHVHTAVVPIALAGIGAAFTAAALYGAHVIGLDATSLRSLARETSARLGWKTALSIAALACAVLAGMETVEQLGSGRFDGLVSAFGSVPAIGLVLVGAIAVAANGALRLLCGWIATAHIRIVHALAQLTRYDANESLSACVLGAMPLALCYSCDAPQAYGKRAPPRPR